MNWVKRLKRIACRQRSQYYMTQNGSTGTRKEASKTLLESEESARKQLSQKKIPSPPRMALAQTVLNRDHTMDSMSSREGSDSNNLGTVRNETWAYSSSKCFS